MVLNFPANGKCLPPGEIWSDATERANISRQVEFIIFGDFQRSKAAIGAIDIFFDPGNGRKEELIQFISRNSFGKPVNQSKMRVGFAAGKYAVPDILSSRGALGKSEHYEIKPNSATGPAEGKSQIRDFAQLNLDFGLLFFPGEEYDPKQSQTFFVVDTGLIVITLELHWFRDVPGLLLYEFCAKWQRKHHKFEATPQVIVMIMAFLFGATLTNGNNLPLPQFR